MRTLALLPLLALFAACSAPENWRSVETETPFGETWRALTDIAATHGYRPDEMETDRGLRVYVSKWREAPAPFRKSARTRLRGKIERPEERPDAWRIDFLVERQMVSDMAPGFEPEDADWSDDGQDGNKEDIILGQLRVRFGQNLGITPEYERMRR